MINAGKESNIAVIQLKSLINPWTEIVGIVPNLVLFLYSFYSLI
jgi:hypothetical protein